MQKNYYIRVDQIWSYTRQNPLKVPVYVACHAKVLAELNNVLNKLGYRQDSYSEVLLDDNYEDFLEKLSKEEIFKYLYRVVGFGQGSDFGKVGKRYVILEPAEKDYPLDCFMSMLIEDNKSVQRIPSDSISKEDISRLSEETNKIDFKQPLFLPETENISEELEYAFAGSVNFDLNGFGYNFENKIDVDKFIHNTKNFLSRVNAKELFQHKYIQTLCEEIENESDEYIIQMKSETLMNVLNSLAKTKYRSHLFISFKAGMVKVNQIDVEPLPKISVEKLKLILREDWV